MPNLLKFERVEPKQNATAAVIWLHGLGADGYDFVPIVPELQLADLAIRFIFPHAQVRPVTLNHGMLMPAWFDIHEISPTAKHDEAGIKAGYEQILALINAQHELGIAYDRIVLVGFSQGGALALYTALCLPNKIAGVAGLSTYLPLNANLRAQIGQKNTLPVFLAHGRQDAVVPIEAGEMTRQVLDELNYPVSFHKYAMGHQVCAQEMHDLSAWLRQLLA